MHKLYPNTHNLQNSLLFMYFLFHYILIQNICLFITSFKINDKSYYYFIQINIIKYIHQISFSPFHQKYSHQNTVLN
jgi:hypothetical protein